MIKKNLKKCLFHFCCLFPIISLDLHVAFHILYISSDGDSKIVTIIYILTLCILIDSTFRFDTEKQSEQHVFYRLMAGGGQGGPS